MQRSLGAVALSACLAVSCGGAARNSAEKASDKPAATARSGTSLAADPLPAGYQAMNVAGVATTPDGNAVVLSDQARGVGVPIFVGDAEALAIMLRLRGQSFNRPLTHDLLDNVLRRLGGRITSVRLDSIKDNVFHATIVIVHAGRRSELDSRASDAVALALGNGVPIYVASDVIGKAGIPLEGLGIERSPEPASDPLQEGGPPPLKL